MSNAHRVKIQNSNILRYLMDHVEGKREMTPTQAATGVALMKKVLPDLSHNQNDNKTSVSFDDDDLQRIYQGALKHVTKS